jgi:hypothetical protein
MSLHDFWTNVRLGANLISPRASAAAPQIDADDLTKRLQRADLWLTPRAVDGFDRSDFSFLSDDELNQLESLVVRFREIASTVNPAAPTPIAAVEEAGPLFLKIVLMLDFDRYEDDEAYRLGKLIERAITPYRPLELAQLRFRTGWDHTGDPGLWIRAFLSDEPPMTEQQFLESAQRMRQLLDPIARRIAPDRWPYLSFHELAELSEPVEAS